MLKTLLITLEFPPDLGGIAKYYSAICEHLPSDKIVVLAPKNKDSRDFDNNQKYKIYRKNLLTSLPIWPKWIFLFWHVLKIIIQEKIKIIQVGQVLPIGYIAFIFKKLFKIPYVVYTHGMDITFSQESERKKYWLKKILQEAKDVVTNSEFTKQEIVKLGIVENKVIIVYPCCSLKQKNKRTREQIFDKYNLHNKKILLTVGRLVERKGQDMVIKALPGVLKKVPDLVYLIVGDGPHYSKLKTLSAELELENKAIFTDAVSDDELSIYYQLCDVFIMISRQIKGDVEGFGMVYLEANSFGKPVIAGRSGGVCEAVIEGQTGLLVDPENVEEISNAIITLFTHPELVNKFGVQGMERVKREFGWTKQVEKLVKIF